jgi:hypothetical protein
VGQLPGEGGGRGRGEGVDGMKVLVGEGTGSRDSPNIPSSLHHTNLRNNWLERRLKAAGKNLYVCYPIHPPPPKKNLSKLEGGGGYLLQYGCNSVR